VSIVGNYSTEVVGREWLDDNPQTDPLQGVVLLVAQGWRYYSRAFGSRRASLAYVCGIDDNGPWAARVAGRPASVAAALAEITPKPARDAAANGRRVIRQGDAFFVECAPRYADEGSIGNLEFDSATRIYTHHPDDRLAHHPVHVPFPHRVYWGSVRGMGRRGNHTIMGD